jgi:hypothetical protein
MITNMTPHSIVILNDDNTVLTTIHASGNVVRLKTSTKSPLFMLGEIKISTTIFGEVEGLPDFKDGTYYIVSQLVKSALANRKDLLVPAELVRNDKGVIIGCKSLGV